MVSDELYVMVLKSKWFRLWWQLGIKQPFWSKGFKLVALAVKSVAWTESFNRVPVAFLRYVFCFYVCFHCIPTRLAYNLCSKSIAVPMQNPPISYKPEKYTGFRLIIIDIQSVWKNMGGKDYRTILFFIQKQLSHCGCWTKLQRGYGEHKCALLMCSKSAKHYFLQWGEFQH